MVLDSCFRAFPYMELRQRGGKEKSLYIFFKYVAGNSLPYRRLSAYSRRNPFLDKRNEDIDARRRTAGFHLS